LADYGNYRLRLDVWEKVGVQEIFDSIISNETFAISGHTSGEIPPEFYTEVNLTEGIILIDWTQIAKRGDYIVAIFDDSVSIDEPFYFVEVVDGSTSTEALFDPNTKELRIDFTHRQAGINSQTLSKKIPIGDRGVNITTTTSEYTNSSQATIEYRVSKGIIAELVVNGEIDKVNLKDDDRFSVNLPETYNEVEVRYSIDDPLVKYLVKFQFIVDNSPPSSVYLKTSPLLG